MKRLLLLLIAVVALSGCSSEDDGNAGINVALLDGGWAYDQVLVDGEWIPYPHNNDCFRKDSFGFRNSPTQPYHFSEQIWQPGDHCPNTTTNLNWKVQGKSIILNFGEYSVVRLQVVKLSADFFHFIMVADLEGDGVPEKQEFKAVPNPDFESF